jgi:hypothetical protein
MGASYKESAFGTAVWTTGWTDILTHRKEVRLPPPAEAGGFCRRNSIIPTFDHFTSKYGFDEGAEYTHAGEHARTCIVQAVNAHLQELSRLDVRLVKFDRNCLHNPCRILVLPWDEKISDEELLANTLTGEIQEVTFSPQELDDENWEFSVVLDQCYYIERPEIWIGACTKGPLTYLGAYVNLAPNQEFPVQAFIEHYSLPIRRHAHSVPEHLHMGAEINEFVHSWLGYADQNGYAFGYDPQVILHENIHTPLEIVE